MKQRLVCSITTVALCSLGLLTGCPFSTKVIPPDPPLPPIANISPENLLLNLQDAYNNSDLVAFGDLLDENYNFIFSQEDQQQPSTPEGFTKDDELLIHTNMFSDLVDRLELSFEFDPADLVFDSDVTSSAADSIWRLSVSSVLLELRGRVPGRPDMVPESWLLENGSQDFWFHKASPDGAASEDAVDPVSGEPLWTIWQWEETSISGSK